MTRPLNSASTCTGASSSVCSSASLNRRASLALMGATLAAPWVAARANGIAGGRPISLVVSYPAGGGADLMARILAPRLSEALGQLWWSRTSQAPVASWLLPPWRALRQMAHRCCWTHRHLR